MTDRKLPMGSTTAWQLLLEAARALTAGGQSPFSREQLIGEVRRLDPTRRGDSLGPVLQGLTDNAPGGVLSQAGRPLHRVGRGLYRLKDPVGDQGRPGVVSLPASPPPTTLDDQVVAPIGAGDVLLIGCVKSKRADAAPARDLFTSPLFARRLAYAERVRRPWFILSAKHALVEPDEVLEPYDVYLADQTVAYRAAWGAWVVERLVALVGPLTGRTVEVHAGAAYVDPLQPTLARHGAALHAPLSGLAMGEQLAWYGSREGLRRPPVRALVVPSSADAAAQTVDGLVPLLQCDHDGLTPSELAAARRPEWQAPGLYSWWVDRAGATDLTVGLGQLVEPGLLYVGQAGATRWPSGRRSSNTLQGRLVGMHLGPRADFSTFRRTLGAALQAPLGLKDSDDARLGDWMQAHLRAVVVPVQDGDDLGRLEQQVLDRLDPPLNLRGRPPTPLRRSLSGLRRTSTS